MGGWKKNKVRAAAADAEEPTENETIELITTAHKVAGDEYIQGDRSFDVALDFASLMEETKKGRVLGPSARWLTDSFVVAREGSRLCSTTRGRAHCQLRRVV